MRIRKIGLMCLVWLCIGVSGAWAQAKNWYEDADISWYTNEPGKDSYTITTAAQLAGLAKLVNEK
ncbi:MAG: hypothetical protein LUD46_07505 [Parabacteroides sp.]|nr:hypothetical protein [Parabacteroides sp.]